MLLEAYTRRLSSGFSLGSYELVQKPVAYARLKERSWWRNPAYRCGDLISSRTTGDRGLLAFLRSTNVSKATLDANEDFRCKRWI